MALINEEFLDSDSIMITLVVRFVFNGMPMAFEYTRNAFEIFKMLGSKPIRYRFTTGYNKRNDKPTIDWEDGLPEDIDIRVAADVVVAKFYQGLMG